MCRQLLRFQFNLATTSVTEIFSMLQHDQARYTTQHRRWSYLLLVVWNNAAHKVGICVIQRLHQLIQLFFVGLSNGSKHSLACCCSPSTKRTDFCHGRRHSNDVSYSDKCMQVTAKQILFPQSQSYCNSITSINCAFHQLKATSWIVYLHT